MKATVTLTDAQIKALPTTPVEMVAAPGSGRVFIPLLAVLVVDTLEGVYTNIGTACQMGVGLNPENDNWLDVLENGVFTGLDPVTDLLGGAGKTIATLSRQQFSNPSSFTMPVFFNDNLAENENKSLEIWGYQIEGNFTGGNVANTLKTTVYYTIIDL